jgi:anti-sigma factor ChrR (cupin superfamily)
MEKMMAIRPDAMEWLQHCSSTTGLISYNKQYVEDKETGMIVKLSLYPAGVVIPLHKHSCAHGMYVIDGVLHTDDGDYGPGSFLWFPEGCIAEHGATPDGDVTVLFITNKAFDIHYINFEKK